MRGITSHPTPTQPCPHHLSQPTPLLLHLSCASFSSRHAQNPKMSNMMICPPLKKKEGVACRSSCSTILSVCLFHREKVPKQAQKGREPAWRALLLPHAGKAAATTQQTHRKQVGAGLHDLEECLSSGHSSPVQWVITHLGLFRLNIITIFREEKNRLCLLEVGQ